MLVTTVEEWNKVVKKLKGSVDPFGDHVIAYDTETVDRGYPNVKITGFSLAWYEDKTSIEGCYVPLNHTSKTVEPPTEQIESDLREILEDPNIQITCHNLKYDRNITLLMDENDPIHIHENTFDTMVVGWMVNTPGVGTRSQRLNDHGSHGLKDWVKEVFDHDIGNLKRLAPTEKVDGSTVIYTDQVEPKDLEQYATDDAVYTLKLRQWLIQNKLLGREEELWDIYNELENPFIFVLAELEKWGMELDDELLASMGEDMTEELDSINRRMYDLRPVEDFEMTEELASEIERAAIAYEELEKEGDISPYEKGQRRNTIFMACGLKDHPVEEKIRDDSLRDEVINHPELAHKIFNPRSDKQLNRVFFEECGIEPLDEKSDKSGLHSTNGDFLKEWQHDHQIAKELLRLRRLTQLNGVFVEGILKRLPEDNRVRTRYSMAISTGRLSSSDPNLQNIVKSDEFPVRKCFQGTGCVKSNIEVYEEDDQGDPLYYKVENDGGFFVINNKEVESWGGPNPPWPILVSDYGQLELRILAHEADDAAMKEAFAQGIDIHGATAAKVYNLPCEADEVRSKYPKKRDEVKIVEYGCVPLDTEILTREGWKSYDEVEIGDQTLGFNDNRNLEWTTITDLAYYKEAPVVETGNSYWSVCTTPNHRWYGDKRIRVDGQREYLDEVFTTEEITSEHRISRSGVFVGQDSSGLNPAEAEVLGWLFSDGTLKWSGKDRNNKEGVRASIYQQKYRGNVAISLDKANIGFTLCKDGRTFYLHSEDIRNLLNKSNIRGKKDVPKLVRSMGKRQVCAFLDAIFLAEGHTQDGRMKITQNEGPFADAIELAAFMRGYYVSRQKHSEGVVKLHLGRSQVTGQKLSKNKDEKEDVWCPKTEYGSWVARQNGQIFVTGNTIYGQGPKGLSRQLGCTEEEAQEIIDDYMGQFPSVENWIDKQHKIVKEQGYVETLSGRKRHLPAGQLPQNGDNWGLIASAERKAVNTPIQGSAADIINKAMVDITKYCLNNSAIDECVFQPPKGSVEHSMDFHDSIWENWLRILVQVHDELIIEMHPSIANWAKMKMGDIMTSSYDLSVPLTVDSAIGKNWQQTKE